MAAAAAAATAGGGGGACRFEWLIMQRRRWAGPGAGAAVKPIMCKADAPAEGTARRFWYQWCSCSTAAACSCRNVLTGDAQAAQVGAAKTPPLSHDCQLSTCTLPHSARPASQVRSTVDPTLPALSPLRPSAQRLRLARRACMCWVAPQELDECLQPPLGTPASWLQPEVCLRASSSARRHHPWPRSSPRRRSSHKYTMGICIEPAESAVASVSLNACCTEPAAPAACAPARMHVTYDELHG